MGTSALRSHSKDRRMPPNKIKNAGKPSDTNSGVNSSTSFNMAGSFNSNELITTYNQAPTPVSSNKTKAQDLRVNATS